MFHCDIEQMVHCEIEKMFHCEIDELIDVIEGNRIYVPCIFVLNKID